MSKKKKNAKNEKKKEMKSKNIMRYAIHIPIIDDYDEFIQKSCFELVTIEYCGENKKSSSIVFLPKKIDSLIKQLEKLGIRAIDIETYPSKYNIHFVEDDNSCGGADLLYDIYANNPCNHVLFLWAERYASHPKSFELIINVAGIEVGPTNEIISKFALLSNVFDTASELKMCSKYIDKVLKELRRNKKNGLKKLFKEKK